MRGVGLPKYAACTELLPTQFYTGTIPWQPNKAADTSVLPLCMRTREGALHNGLGEEPVSSVPIFWKQLVSTYSTFHKTRNNTNQQSPMQDA